jgi:Uma2 family endonuclease
MTPAIQPITITLEEFLARPEREDGQREELIEGEIVLSPEPKLLHAILVGRLRRALEPLTQQGFLVEALLAAFFRDRFPRRIWRRSARSARRRPSNATLIPKAPRSW